MAGFSAKIHPLKTLFSTDHLSEWGTPPGSLGRLWPLLIAGQFQQKTLWLNDGEALFYPPSWYHLGFSPQNLHFLKSAEPRQELREVLRQNLFPIIIWDSQKRLRSQDFHFYRQQCRRHGIRLFVLRPFLLSARNGNPFCHSRWNTFCEGVGASPSLRLSCLKGSPREDFRVPLLEVLHGPTSFLTQSA